MRLFPAEDAVGRSDRIEFDRLREATVGLLYDPASYVEEGPACEQVNQLTLPIRNCQRSLAAYVVLKKHLTKVLECYWYFESPGFRLCCYWLSKPKKR